MTVGLDGVGDGYDEVDSLYGFNEKYHSNPKGEELVQKVREFIQGKIVNPMGEGSGELRVNVEWGGKEGPEVKVGGSGRYEDNYGNYYKVDVDHKSNGEGSAQVSAGHKEDKEDRK